MQLSDAEWVVMNMIWERDAVEASDVIAVVGPMKDWSDATVKTILHRLVKKGALETTKVGKKYQYAAAAARNDCVRKASQSFIDRIFRGRTAPAIMHLVGSSKLSDEELSQLRALLDAKTNALSRKKQ